MATFSSLASELLSHILRLSTEDETPEEQQRLRFSFGLIARAFYLATVDATDFHVSSGADEGSVNRILIPLQALEVLSLQIKSYLPMDDIRSIVGNIALPRLKNLQISLCGWAAAFNNTLLVGLATNSTSGIEVLDLHLTQAYSITPEVVKPLLPHLANFAHFTWNPVPDPLKPDTRAAVLSLLGAMKSLQSITMPMLVSVEDFSDDDDEDEINERPLIDPALFDTLATLPSLHKVDLLVATGILEERPVLPCLSSRPTSPFDPSP
ncbi:hypothetical protein RQP46_006083 [Phenoliferia psychrophenolica]